MIRYLVLAIVFCCIISSSSASCTTDGKSSQSVSLSVEGKGVDRWQVINSEIHLVQLPKGFKLGVKIEPATTEKYREFFFSKHPLPAVDELVKIELYDMRESSPKLISTTWGGSNSIQGFGPRGGANGVPVMGEQAELWFHKPVCIKPEALTENK